MAKIASRKKRIVTFDFTEGFSEVTALLAFCNVKKTVVANGKASEQKGERKLFDDR